MNNVSHNQPFVVFKAKSGRMMLVELWSAAAGILVVSTILAVLQKLDLRWLIGTVVVTVVGVALIGIFMRRSSRIVIGDSWIEGPAAGGRATVQFDTMDRERSGFGGGRLRIMSLSGRGIDARTAWYSSEDIEEIKRLLRDRSGAAGN
jgi:hypothetical protein